MTQGSTELRGDKMGRVKNKEINRPIEKIKEKDNKETFMAIIKILEPLDNDCRARILSATAVFYDIKYSRMY